MEPDRYRSHPSAVPGEPRTSGAPRSTILRAVRLLMAENQIREMTAYAILVHASADSGTSVRETAARINARSA